MSFEGLPDHIMSDVVLTASLSEPHPVLEEHSETLLTPPFFDLSADIRVPLQQ